MKNKTRFKHDFFTTDGENHFLILIELQGEQIKDIVWLKYPPKLFLEYPRNPWLLN